MEMPHSGPCDGVKFNEMLLDKMERVPLLIEYFVTCGIRQKELLDYIEKAEESKTPLMTALQNETLKKSKLEPEVTSRYPPVEKPSFPFPGDLQNVFAAYYL